MCGRVTVRTSAKKLQEAFSLGMVVAELDRPRFNLAPTQEMPVVINDGQKELTLHRWGLIPSWAKDPKIASKLINARAETLIEKPSFRTAFQKRRCLILIDGFYEWRASKAGGPKQAFHIRRPDQAPFALAGLWEEWTPRDGVPEVVRTCSIITTTANQLMSSIHDRMPVILAPAAFDAWLRPGKVEPAELLPLLVPAPDDFLTLVPVSSLVNSSRNDKPECVLAVSGDTIAA